MKEPRSGTHPGLLQPWISASRRQAARKKHRTIHLDAHEPTALYRHTNRRRAASKKEVNKNGERTCCHKSPPRIKETPPSQASHRRGSERRRSGDKAGGTYSTAAPPLGVDPWTGAPATPPPHTHTPTALYTTGRLERDPRREAPSGLEVKITRFELLGFGCILQLLLTACVL